MVVRRPSAGCAQAMVAAVTAPTAATVAATIVRSITRLLGSLTPYRRNPVTCAAADAVAPVGRLPIIPNGFGRAPKSASMSRMARELRDAALPRRLSFRCHLAGFGGGLCLARRLGLCGGAARGRVSLWSRGLRAAGLGLLRGRLLRLRLGLLRLLRTVLGCCRLARLGATLWLPAGSARRAGIKQGKRLFEGHRLRRHVGGQCGVDAVVAHVGSVAAVLHHHRATLIRVLSERATGIGAETALARSLGLPLREQRHRTVEPDIENIIAGLEIGVSLAVLHVGAEAADTGHDRLAVFRMPADLARQREQPKRAVEVDVVRVQALGDASAFRLLAVDGLAELHIGAEPAGAQRHFEAGVLIHAELLHAAVGAVERSGKLARIAAFGIVRAADETAEFAELERKPPGPAVRALARIGAVRPLWKQMRGEHFIERIDDLGDAQLLDVADRVGELLPEVAQQIAPGEFVVGDAVELLFEVGRETVFDVAREEAFQE